MCPWDTQYLHLDHSSTQVGPLHNMELHDSSHLPLELVPVEHDSMNMTAFVDDNNSQSDSATGFTDMHSLTSLQQQLEGNCTEATPSHSLQSLAASWWLGKSPTVTRPLGQGRQAVSLLPPGL